MNLQVITGATVYLGVTIYETNAGFIVILHERYFFHTIEAAHRLILTWWKLRLN